MTKGAKKGKKRKKSDNNSDQSADQVSDNSEHHACSSLLGAAGETLYGKPPMNDHGDHGDHDEQPLQRLITSTPLPEAPILLPNANGVSIQSKLDHIIERLHKLDTIEAVSQKLDKLEGTITAFEGRLVSVETKTNELEQSVKFLSDQYDTQKASFKEINELGDTLVQSHQQVMQEVSEMVTNLVTERDKLRDTVTDLQWRSMKMNLIFTGLEGESTQENTESKLRDFLYFELGINDNIQFGNVHRFGRFERGKHRPIVARFLFHQDLQLVKDSAHKLRGSKFSIREQYPAAIEDKRKDLYPLMRRLRGDGENPKLIRDRLYLRGKLLKPDDVIALLSKYNMIARSQAYAEDTAVKTVNPTSHEVHMRSPQRHSHSPSHTNNERRASASGSPRPAPESARGHSILTGANAVSPARRDTGDRDRPQTFASAVAQGPRFVSRTPNNSQNRYAAQGVRSRPASR